MKRVRKRKCVIITGMIAVGFVILAAGSAVYLNDFYRADSDAIASFEAENPVEKKEIEDGIIAYITANTEMQDIDKIDSEKADTEMSDSESAQAVSDAGFIFYPGGKVEYTAYEPLMEACASEGIFCVLLEMPFNLAVLDMDAAEGIQELYPEIEHWYIGGHSLGGSMAASYLEKHREEYEGLILLGAYSTADLSESELDVLSVYGSEDGVMNREKYEKYRENLPDDFTEFVIDGGCHAGFGMYGAQEGDGIPSITSEEQIVATAEAVAEFVESGKD